MIFIFSTNIFIWLLSLYTYIMNQKRDINQFEEKKLREMGFLVFSLDF
jgi:hypothetical protein